jgi:AAA family ATPase
LGIPKFLIAGASLSSPFHGETESKLRDVFTQAKSSKRSIVIIDEVDALAPKREDSGEVERRVVAELLTLMDGLDDKSTEETSRVLVIACTNRPNTIDPALRRPGRFDKEIEIGIPDADARLSILKVHLRSSPHQLDPSFIQSLAARTHGFVGADIASLVQTAGLQAIRRCLASNLPTNQMRLESSDLEVALLTTQPSAMREVFVEVPAVYWKDIGGQADVKQNLTEAIEWPLLHKATFERLGAKPPSGILLYGPPGCSKTLMAKAVATESGLNFMSIKGPEVRSLVPALNVIDKQTRSSTSMLASLSGRYESFSERRGAMLRRCSSWSVVLPSVFSNLMFVQDEIDVIASSRSDEDHSGSTRVLTTLLTEMDGIEGLRGVVILAATNRPWAIVRCRFLIRECLTSK